jgi:hypothetical protein
MFRARAVLAEATAQARCGIAGWSNGTGDDPLALLEAGDRRAEPFDDSNRFMADGQAGADRIFALQNVNVGAADRRGSDSHQGIERPHGRDGLLVQHDPSPLYKNRRFHRLACLRS